jgi:hypothetical protein
MYLAENADVLYALKSKNLPVPNRGYNYCDEITIAHTRQPSKRVVGAFLIGPRGQSHMIRMIQTVWNQGFLKAYDITNLTAICSNSCHD